MDNIVEILETVTIGTLVTRFLLNSSRALQAIKLCQECLIILNNTPEEREIQLGKACLCTMMGEGYCLLNDDTSVIECAKKSLDFVRRLGSRGRGWTVTSRLAKIYKRQGKYEKAEDLYKKSLSVTMETGDKKKEALCCENLGTIYTSLSKYGKAEEYQRKALAIAKEIGAKDREAACYGNLGVMYQSLYQYGKAEEYLRKELAIAKEIGDKHVEAACYGNLGVMYQSLHQYEKAEEYLRKELAIAKEIGDKHVEAACYGNLAVVYQSLGQYEKAEEYLRKELAIAKEIGDKHEEAACYGNLGVMYQSLYQYEKAEEYLRKALAIAKEIGHKHEEAACYGKLGAVYLSLLQYEKADEYLRKAPAIAKEIGDKHVEAACYGNLGAVYQSFQEYGKAEEYLRNSLAIAKEIGYKKVEAVGYGNLGVLYLSLLQYEKADEYLRKALAMAKEIGDKHVEARCHLHLGAVYQPFEEYGKAEEHLRNALSIKKEIGDKHEEAECYGDLGAVYEPLGQYEKAEEYLRKALAIAKEIGDKPREANCYGNLGAMYKSLGQYGKSEEYLRKALAIAKETGDQRGEAVCYGNLGSLRRVVGKHSEAKDYHEKALAMIREISDMPLEAMLHLQIGHDIFLAGDGCLQHEIVPNLRSSIDKCEKMRSFLGSNDQFKISLLDKHSLSYHLLSAMFCFSGNAKEALSVLELGRARALADLISALYSTQQQTSVNPPSWADMESIVKKECNCSCLYISYFQTNMFLWVLSGNKQLHFREIDVNECFVTMGLRRTVLQVFSEESFRHFNVHPEEQCEDRSLAFSKASDSTHEPDEEGSLAAYRLVEEEEEENLQHLPTRAERYRMIIAPVADFLDQPELIIVPDPALYKVPFAALENENGNYLSEEYRIRIVPSLTTLGLIHDSPADYHSQTDALIVGEPDVRDVSYKGSLGVLCRLPSAKEEAEMIGELIGAVPLLGRQATKQAALQRIPSVSLIHFAAHGDAERGEIALAPQYPINGIPTEKDYLLTMADISLVQLRAKLVVLSCCHSAQGHVKAEGVVGIARAFLGSGARSVLVALWAIPDEATKKLMSRFYEHLVRGESASESLHQAMKWMRNNGYPDVRDWAPFMLIGDNVTFNFVK